MTEVYTLNLLQPTWTHVTTTVDRKTGLVGFLRIVSHKKKCIYCTSASSLINKRYFLSHIKQQPVVGHDNISLQ